VAGEPVRHVDIESAKAGIHHFSLDSFVERDIGFASRAFPNDLQMASLMHHNCADLNRD